MLVQDIVAPAPRSTRWRLATRLAFRFTVAYVGLYVVGIIPSTLITWVAGHVFHATTPLSFAPTGSGDTTVNWGLRGTENSPQRHRGHREDQIN